MEAFAPERSPASLATAVTKHNPIIAIVSPPRCSSTAFSRVFWQHPAIRYYAHEPFEVTYYRKEGLDQVAHKLKNPIDLAGLDSDESSERGNGLVIKEMPYQVGERFPRLLEIVTSPIIFLMRNPRRSIASRMAKKEEVGDSPFFPQIESGWALLKQHIDTCRQRGAPYMVVNAADFRNQPEVTFSEVFERLGLPFSPEMLTWEAHGEIELDNLGGDHSHLYRHVLMSTGIEPEVEEIPPLTIFPVENGWRAHVEHCLAIYNEIREDPNYISSQPTRPQHRRPN